jgi:hypothetical protein
MNNLQKLNTIAISIPFIIALFAIFETGFLLLALLSTMITGLLQIIIAFIILYQNINKHIISYLLLVVIFFLLVYIYSNYIFEYEMINYIWIIPILLCMYLTYIVHLD